MTIFVFLAARAILIYHPQLHINFRVFLGYSSEHKGYRCLDLHSNRIIVSRHVIFDETVFPFADMSSSP